MRIGWLLVACLACSKPEQKAPAPPVHLYTRAELAQLEASLMTHLTANQTRTCAAPVLHGDAKTGDATNDLVALVEQTGSLAACTTRMRDVTQPQPNDVFALFEARDPALLAIAKDCGPVVDTAFATAAAYANVCSPYQPGRRHRADDEIGILRATNILGVHARLRAEAGDPVGALWSLVTALRPLQDLTRGHVDLVTSMVAAGGYRIVSRHALAILGGAAVPPDAATALSAAVDALLASEPHFGSTLAGENEQMALYLGLARIKPAGWEPPGGTSPELRKDIMEPSEAGASTLSPQDLGGLLLATSLAQHTAHGEACPETMSFTDCRQGLDAMQTRRAKDAQNGELLRDPFALLSRLAKDSDPEKARLEVQHQVRDTMLAISMPSFGDYVTKKGRAVAGLGAVRVALEIEHTGACKPVEVPAVNTLLGSPMRVASDDKQVTLRWPAAGDADSDFIVRCP